MIAGEHSYSGQQVQQVQLQGGRHEPKTSLDVQVTRSLVPEERRATWRAFRRAVNMTPGEIERWIDTRERPPDETEPTRRILELRRKRKPELTDADYAVMRRVVGHIHRHAAQGHMEAGAAGEWRERLMRWGHDSMKKSRY